MMSGRRCFTMDAALALVLAKDNDFLIWKVAMTGVKATSTAAMLTPTLAPRRLMKRSVALSLSTIWISMWMIVQRHINTQVALHQWRMTAMTTGCCVLTETALTMMELVRSDRDNFKRSVLAVAAKVVCRSLTWL